MKRKVYLTAATLTVILVGCSSFNNSFNHYTLPPPAAKEEIHPLSDTKLGPDDEEPPPNKNLTIRTPSK